MFVVPLYKKCSFLAFFRFASVGAFRAGSVDVLVICLFQFCCAFLLWLCYCVVLCNVCSACSALCKLISSNVGVLS